MPGHMVSTYDICSNTNRGFDRLRLRYVGVSSSRVRLATPDGPSQRITRSFLPSSPPPSPPPLTLLSPRCVPVSPTQSRPSSSQSIASPPAPVLLAVARPVHPSALLRCLAVRQPSTQGQRQGCAPECGGRRNQHDPPAPAHSEVGCDETDLSPRTDPASPPPRPRHVSCPSLACPLRGPAGPTLATRTRTTYTDGSSSVNAQQLA